MHTDPQLPPGEPAAGRRAPRFAPLRAALAAITGTLALALLALLARELIAARIPQDRAALEQLIRQQTGLEVRFARLTVRWGWYGPEARLTELTLGAPQAAPVLTARELTVGIDTWRSLRTGALEAARMRVRDAQIDLGADTDPARAALAPRAGAVTYEPLQLLARWRGGRIDLDDARVRLPGTAQAPLVVTLVHASLMRRGSQWNAAGELLLPDGLGSRARLAAHAEGDMARRATLAGTVTLAADHLDLGGWRALAPQDLRGLLPERGQGRVDLAVEVRAGETARIAALVRAREVRWDARGSPGAPLALARLDADAQLTRTARGEWRLALGSIDTGVPGTTASALLMLRGSAARGNVHGLPVQTLAALAAWADGALPLGLLHLSGEVRALNFDWDPARAHGERLAASAQGRLALEDPDAGLRLTGIDTVLTVTDVALAARLRGRDSELHLARGEPQVLGGIDLTAELHGMRDGPRWMLVGDRLEITREAARVQARGSLAGAPGASPRLHAQLTLAATPLPAALAVLSPQTLAALAPAAAHARAGHIAQGRLEWQGTLGAPRVRGSLELTGAALAANGAWPGIEGLDGHIEWQDLRVRARLAAARLRPFGDVAPLEALRGTLAFSDGHLQRSNLSGTWLGGPVTLEVSEPRGRSGAAVAILARGTLAAPALLATTGLTAAGVSLSGTSEWHAQLRAQPDAGGSLRWQMTGYASLAGLGSHLPEPLGKIPGVALPLRLAGEGEGGTAQLRVSLGTRLTGVLALARAADQWRIARGAVRLDERAAALPAMPVFTVEGNLERLDLAHVLGLWRATDELVPPVIAHLNATGLQLAEHRFAPAVLRLEGGAAGEQLEVRSPGFEAALQWPKEAGPGHPVRVHIAALEAAATDAALAPALAALARAPVQLGIREVSFAGRPLGRLEASFQAHGDTFTLTAVRLASSTQTLEATGQCVAAGECAARVDLEGTDLGGLLGSLGFRADTQARHVALSGDLHWPEASGAPLATLSGHLHMLLEDGSVHAPEPAAAPPLALLVVPALVDGLVPGTPGDSGGGAAPALQFARLGADYTVRDGVAVTDNLHLDGDAEILVRARIGLLRQDYDGEAFILRGEERLPRAVRGMGPTPKVAALWLSLRDWFSGRSPESPRTVLRLRGTWNDPIVSAADPKEPASVTDTP